MQPCIYWIKEFISRKYSVFDDDLKSGRPVEISDENEKQCADLLRENRCSRVDELAEISSAMALAVSFYQILAFANTAAVWFRRSLFENLAEVASVRW